MQLEHREMHDYTEGEQITPGGGEGWWDEGRQYSHYSVQQVPSG